MNLWGSSRGSGAAHEVEPDRYLFSKTGFHGAIGVDLGLGFGTQKNERGRERERERKEQPRIHVGGKMKSMWGF